MGHLTKTKASRLSAATRPVVEQLEKRQLLSVTLTDGTLAIVGTEAADTIEIYPSTKVSDRLVVSVNGVAKRYALSAVQRIQVDALGGDDRVNVSSLAGRITVPVTLQGGEGNDTLAGALGNDLIRGGAGADFISGGGGNDVLNGDRGKDRILGGEGDDTINGGLGSDAISTDLKADNTKDVVLPSRGNDSLNAQATPNFPLTTFTGTIEGYSPQQIRRAYGFGDLADKSYTNRGQGQAIAIIGAFHSPTARADLAYFSRQFGLPVPTKKTFLQVSASGHRPTEDPSASSEFLMDIQWAHAIAPAATIILVEAESMLKADLYAAIPVATKLLNKKFGGGVVSMSFGGAEIADQVQLDSVFNNRNTKNISFVAASGDTPVPSYPATSPYVLAVGGTALYLDDYGNRVSGDLVTTINVTGNKQMPWGYADSELTVLGYPVVHIPGGERAWFLGGGGPSSVYNQPSYQANRGVNLGGIIDPVTGLIRYTRGTPDIAWAADPRPLAHYRLDVTNTGTGNNDEFFNINDDFTVGSGAVAVFNSYGGSPYGLGGGQSGWFAQGGTSEGAPQVAAMIALANQVRAERKLPKLGNTLVPSIYRLGMMGGDQYFHDVTVAGANYDPTTQQFLTAAGYGWDYATGFGSPNAASLIPALAGIKTPYMNKKGTVSGMFTTYNPTVSPNLGSQMSWIQFKAQVTFQGSNTITLSPPAITQVFMSTTTTTGTATKPNLSIYMYGPDVDDNSLIDATDGHVIYRNLTPITLYRNGNHVYGTARFEVVDTTAGTGGGTGGGAGAVGNRLYGNFKIEGTIKGRDKLDLTMYSIDKNGNAIKNVWTPYRTSPSLTPVTYIKGTITT